MKKIIKLLKKSNKIALISHKSPDPDTIGSTLALFHALFQKQKSVSCFCDDEVLDNYAFLGAPDFYNKSEINDDFDLVVYIDVPSRELMGDLGLKFIENSNTIRVDHHKSGENFAKHNLVCPYSACGILIYEIITRLKLKITPEIATCIYFAICGDTGIFRNLNTDAKTFDICSKLLSLGADIKRVYQDFFDKKTVPILRLTSNALLNAYINDEYKFVIMNVSKADYENFGANQNDNIGNLPNSYLNCGYKIAVILKEKEDGIHISLRSKSEYDCSKIAEIFGGGGHKNASGCRIEKPISEAQCDVENAIISYLNDCKI